MSNTDGIWRYNSFIILPTKCGEGMASCCWTKSSLSIVKHWIWKSAPSDLGLNKESADENIIKNELKKYNNLNAAFSLTENVMMMKMMMMHNISGNIHINQVLYGTTHSCSWYRLWLMNDMTTVWCVHLNYYSITWLHSARCNMIGCENQLCVLCWTIKVFGWN